MTPPSPMTRDELLELAALDAFGLLDDYEAALYTRSFHHAPVAVQDEVKRIQAAFAGDELLLPDVEVPDGLRGRVVAAMANAIERESEELAPLAMIGRARVRRSEAMGRIGLGSTSQFWRAAAFIMAGTAVALSYFWAETARRANEIAMIALQMANSAELQPFLDDPVAALYLADPNTLRVTLIDASLDEPDRTRRYAKILIREGSEDAMLLVQGLPDAQATVRLSYLDEAGARREVMSFATKGTRSSAVRTGITVPAAAVASGTTWQITYVDGEGEAVVLSGTVRA